MRILPVATVNKISDYSGQICTKNSEFVVKNRLISYIPKIRFSSIIKKSRVLTQKFMGEKIWGMTFNMYYHVFLIIFPNFLFKSVMEYEASIEVYTSANISFIMSESFS